MSRPTRVSVSVTSDDAQVITRAVEALSRAAAGLALEGVPGLVFFGPDVDEADE